MLASRRPEARLRSVHSPELAERTPPEPKPRTSLLELGWLFLRLGSTALGGPAVHIAMMQDEVVRRRRWLSDERFLDMVSASNLIPGPNSTELAIHIGWARRRASGLCVAGLAFIVPAMLITMVCGWAYVRFGTLPAASWLLYGVKPVILSVVVQAIWSLASKAVTSTLPRLLGVLALALSLLDVHELIVLFGTGLLSVALAACGTHEPEPHKLSAAPLLPVLVASTIPSLPTLPALFWVFLKVGSVLFGSGYVLLAFLRAELVERFHWLSEAQLLDAIVVGQVTPGPVFTTATFVGYLLAGPGGALVATAGIFLPAFVFVALSGPLVPRLRASRKAAAFLDGVNVASLALMVVVTLRLARAAVVDLPTALLALVAAILLLRFRLSSTWLIVGGALVGGLLFRLGLSHAP